MDYKSALEGVEALRATVPEAELSSFYAGLASRYGVAAEVAGSLATGAETLTTDSDISPEAVESTDHYDDTDVLASLSPERRERATALKASFAEKFSTTERALSPEDFGVVLVGEGEAQTAVVLLISGNGLYKVSYDRIMDKKKANKAAYTVTVDGQTIDSREAMTWDTYRAFIASAKAQGPTPLPDSEPLAKENNEPWTGTWLTGEQADGFRAGYGLVSGGDARRTWRTRHGDWSFLRFRPAAAV